jgi:hypothetical protein
MSISMREMQADLRLALERWRQADYHWSLEFGRVTPTWQEWTPEDPDFQRIDAMLRESKNA